MKKKIALLLAAAMTMSMLPVNAFAASTNALYNTPSNVQKTSIMGERTATYSFAGAKVTTGAGATPYYFAASAIASGAPAGTVTLGSRGLEPVYGNNDASSVVSSADLVIIPNTGFTAGNAFRLTLSNAEWFFRNTAGGEKYGSGFVNASNLASSGSASTGLPTLNPGIDNGFAVTTPSNPIVLKATGATGAPSIFQGATFDTSATTAERVALKYDLVNNFDTNLGSYTVLNSTKTASGTYQRVNAANRATAGYVQPYNYGGKLYQEVKYSMSINQDAGKSEAIFTFDETVNDAMITSATTSTQPYVIVIPMIVRTTAENDITVAINSQLTGVTSQTLYFASTGTTGLTMASTAGAVTARYEFPNDRIKIEELRIGSLGSGRITLRAPRGFYFSNPATAELKNYAGVGTGTMTRGTDYDMTYRVDSASYYTQGTDQSVIDIDIKNLTRSTNFFGALWIEKLSLYAEENAPDGPIMVGIEGYEFNTPGVPTSGLATRQIVTTQTFSAGTKSNWVSTLTAASVPELFNGRYDRDYDVTTANSNQIIAAMANSVDAEHLAGRVTFKESAVSAWWSRRVTDLVLSDGAKFRKVKVIKEGLVELPDADKTSLADVEYYTTVITGGAGRGVYLNDGIRHGNVTVDGNKLTFSNLTVNNNKLGQLQFDTWISIEPGKTGDITLTAAGTVVTGTGSDLNVAANPKCTIAKAFNPIEITVDQISDVKIGYQFQPGANIVIKENVLPTSGRPGLRKGRQVLVTVTDMISTDLLFAPDVKLAVTSAGTLPASLSPVTSITNGYVSRNVSTLYGAGTNNGGTLGFTVLRESEQAKPSTITLSNIQLKVDRSVPESNLDSSQKQGYKVLVWGTAIGENFGRGKDQFATPGLSKEYVKVISAANDKTGVITDVVKVPVGEKYYMVGSKTMDMDAAAYISPASNSVMVPVRFVANALGIKDEQVIYDDANKTVTIITPARVIQFKTDSSIMTVNGTQVSMLSPAPEKLPVKAENKNSRVYIPFRALGEAMGVNVAWDGTTQTASYSGVAAAVAATPAPSAAPAK